MTFLRNFRYMMSLLRNDEVFVTMRYPTCPPQVRVLFGNSVATPVPPKTQATIDQDTTSPISTPVFTPETTPQAAMKSSKTRLLFRVQVVVPFIAKRPDRVRVVVQDGGAAWLPYRRKLGSIPLPPY